MYREENFSKSENQQQTNPKGKGPLADVTMVFMLPMEFLALFSDDEEISLAGQIAQLVWQNPLSVWTHRHLPLS